MSTILTQIFIYARSPSSPRAVLVAGHRRFPCLIGRNGLTTAKREGDGASPKGSWRAIKGFWRNDRLQHPVTGLNMRALGKSDGWCDAPGHGQYNRPVRLPFAASHEALWRKDSAYDIVIMLDYNINPRRQSRGSAIFLHLIRDGATHTQGCVALELHDLRKLLPAIGPKTRIVFGAGR